MNSNSNSKQSGHVMVATLLLTIMLGAIAMTYLLASFRNNRSVAFENALVRARLAADEGLQRSIAELKSGVDVGEDGLGSLVFEGDDDRSIVVTATDLGGNLFRVHSSGQVAAATQSAEMVAQILPPVALGSETRAAITAEGEVTTLGNIEVDGRDWNQDGTFIVAPGVFGISSMQTITNSGSSEAGGNGIAPANPPDPASIEPAASWADGIDNDGDGVVDEESFNGLDDDGDGEVDEDTNDYPSEPDVFLGLEPGTLLDVAVANGTYFSSESSLTDYIDANGGYMPGGQVIYADFDHWQPVHFGNDMNVEPSIIIHHNSSGTALMKNIHGSFKGLVLCDLVEHINGDFLLIGSLMSFADESIGNAFGNGSAVVLYSSIVLSGLPSSATQSRARVLSWSRAAAAN